MTVGILAVFALVLMMSDNAAVVDARKLAIITICLVFISFLESFFDYDSWFVSHL